MIKMLLPAYGKHGSAVVAVDGRLRVVDAPKRTCHGYANGCVCTDCMARAKEQRRKLEAQTIPLRIKECECDRPLGLAESTCSKCGHLIHRPVAA